MPFASIRLCWRYIGIAIISAFVLHTDTILAQITPDTTLPNNSNVTLEDNTFKITGGSTAGSNLFHSFKDFSINNGSSAFFNNAVGIQNIISRVTGNSISNIDGLIKANGRANLFFINPNGIIFGENAKLEIGGSFIGSTANAIQFGNLGTFSATDPYSPPSLLTINPSALSFSQTQASTIEGNFTPSGNNSSGTSTINGLRVSNGKNLLLVGGNVNINNGRLTALGGRVEVGGLAGTGNVALETDGNNFRLGFPASSTRADVSLINNAGINVASDNGGSIVVNARNLEMDASFLQAGIRLRLGSVNSQAGDITINATESINMTSGSYIFNLVQPEAIGKGGNINITTGSLSASDGSQIGTGTLGQGDSGSVNINARDAISFDRVSKDGFDASGIFGLVFNFKFGRGGDINITTGSLSIKNGARINSSTFGTGDAGKVNINARDFVSLEGVDIGGKNSAIITIVGTQEAQGNGGDVNITTKVFSLTNGAQIMTDTAGIGNAGNVSIKADDSVLIDGAINNGLSSVIFSNIYNSNAIGNGGSIDISTKTLSLTNGATIIVSGAESGNAGNINILANSVRLDNNSILNADTRSNKTDITQATINITSKDLILRSASNITTNAVGSLIIGGDININTDVSGAFENSKITANSDNFRGGNINIKTQGLFLSPDSAITATGATSALDGNVNITTLIDPSRGLVEIPISLVDTSNQISNACIPGNPGFENTFTVTGRGGLPINPYEQLQDQSTNTAWVRFQAKPENSNRVTINHNSKIAVVPTIIEASGWTNDSHGNIELVAPTSQTPQTPHSVSCSVLK